MSIKAMPIRTLQCSSHPLPASALAWAPPVLLPVLLGIMDYVKRDKHEDEEEDEDDDNDDDDDDDDDQ